MSCVKGMHDSSVGRAPAEKTGAILTRVRVSDMAREVEGPRVESASALLSLQKVVVDAVLRLCRSQLIKH